MLNAITVIFIPPCMELRSADSLGMHLSISLSLVYLHAAPVLSSPPVSTRLRKDIMQDLMALVLGDTAYMRSVSTFARK